MAFVAIRGIADKLSKDEGADQVSFAASEDFDVGRVVSVGMTQDEIDEMTFDGVAGWRVVFLNDGSGEGTTVSAGELELTTDGANPVSSPYYMYLAFPASGTGAAPVALFLRSEGKIVFHVRGLGCDVAVAALAGTARRGPPPGSIC
jgi:hypothetical protein